MATNNEDTTQKTATEAQVTKKPALTPKSHKVLLGVAVDKK